MGTSYGDGTRHLTFSGATKGAQINVTNHHCYFSLQARENDHA